MNELGKTYYVDFKTKEYYTHLREYSSVTNELEELHSKASIFNSYEADWCLDMIRCESDKAHAIESLKDIIAENVGA